MFQLYLQKTQESILQQLTRRWPPVYRIDYDQSSVQHKHQISILLPLSTTRSFVCILIGSETAGGGCWTLLCSRLQT